MGVTLLLDTFRSWWGRNVAHVASARGTGTAQVLKVVIHTC